MRGRWAIGSVLALVALLAGLAPAPAAAGSPSAPQLYRGIARLNDELALMGQGSSTLGLPSRPALSELRFENSDGYAISVVAYGQTVALSVRRARPHAGGGGAKRRLRARVAVTTYLAHGEVTPSTIVASFGDRGRVALRFHPSGRQVHATRKAGCTKPNHGVIADLGVFAGELRFEGEGGYTSAEVHRVSGRSVDVPALLSCLFGISPGHHVALPPPSAPLGIHLPGLVSAGLGSAPSSPSVPTHPSAGPVSTTLVADSKEALSRIVFAARARGKGRTHFLALEQVSEGSIGVVRVVSAHGAPSALDADRTLSHAIAAPPPPFSGTATLQRGAASSKTWSGTLAVSFLGAPHVPLTGPAFGALLARGF